MKRPPFRISNLTNNQYEIKLVLSPTQHSMTSMTTTPQLRGTRGTSQVRTRSFKIPNQHLPTIVQLRLTTSQSQLFRWHSRSFLRANSGKKRSKWSFSVLRQNLNASSWGKAATIDSRVQLNARSPALATSTTQTTSKPSLEHQAPIPTLLNRMSELLRL